MKARLLISLALGAATAAACRDTQAVAVTAGTTVADSADQVLFTVRYLLVSKGVQRGELLADTAYILGDQTRFDFRRAHVNFTTETGQPQGTMQSDRAVYDMRQRTLEGWGNVVVKMVDGRTLKSPHVTYHEATGQISSDTTYTLARGDRVQTGTGFTANSSFTQFSCMRNCGGAMGVRLPEP
jgi:LPS export ABC transporter protein LptC